jgi:Ribonuclease G/E
VKGRVILYEQPKSRANAALVVDGRLEDLILEPPCEDRTPPVGAVLAARIGRRIPKTSSAFVELHCGRSGYLKDAGTLESGAKITVQVHSYAEPGKAIPVTRHLLNKGPRLIYTPGKPGVNVSRKLRDGEERARLQAGLADVVEGGGLIIRSAAAGADLHELCIEASELAIWTADWGTTPWSPNAWDAVVSTWTDPLPDMVLVWAPLAPLLTDEPTFGHRALFLQTRVADGPDLFDHYGVWDEIERLKSPRIDLPSRAWMAVEATRAMVTVDVNTAGEFGGGAALTANLEAARELPRQLRLRGLGGQVIIDFAPLRKSDRKRIEEALKAAFRRDPIETTLAGWTPLGNFELQRKRERRPLSELLP